MKRQWKIQRKFVHSPDGERRWDQAYQLLLAWSQATTEHRAATNVEEEEETIGDEDSGVCSGIQPTPGTAAGD